MAKRIALISTFGYPLYNSSVEEDGIGGTEVQLYNLAKALKGECGVSVIVSDYGQSKMIEHDGIVFYRAMNLKKVFLNYIRAPFLFFTALSRAKADIYITSPAGLEMYMTALYCFVSKKKFIHRVAHDSEVDGTFWKNNLLKFVHKLVLRMADCIVTQTEIQKLQLWNNYQKESIVIPNGFIIPKREEFNKKGMLWVARGVEWKRPEILFRIADHFPEEQFTMICPGKGSYYEKIKREAKLRKNINFIKNVPFQNIQEYYNNAKIFLSTSEKEGFPNAFLQACIGGTPIVSLDVDPDNFLIKNNIGIMTQGNFEEFLRAIKILLDDHFVWSNMSKNGYDYALNQHDLQETEKKWKDIFGKIISNN